MNFIHVYSVLNHQYKCCYNIPQIFSFNIIYCFFTIINLLKFNMNIGLITYPLSTCSVRWRPVQGVSYFFYMETLVKKDIGGIHQNLLCQSNIELTSGRKRNERHQSLFNDALVVSSNLLFCATCIPYYETLHFN